MTDREKLEDAIEKYNACKKAIAECRHMRNQLDPDFEDNSEKYEEQSFVYFHNIKHQLWMVFQGFASEALKLFIGKKPDKKIIKAMEDEIEKAAGEGFLCFAEPFNGIDYFIMCFRETMTATAIEIAIRINFDREGRVTSFEEDNPSTTGAGYIEDADKYIADKRRELETVRAAAENMYAAIEEYNKTAIEKISRPSRDIINPGKTF